MPPENYFPFFYNQLLSILPPIVIPAKAGMTVEIAGMTVRACALVCSCVSPDAEGLAKNRASAEAWQAGPYLA